MNARLTAVFDNIDMADIALLRLRERRIIPVAASHRDAGYTPDADGGIYNMASMPAFCNAFNDVFGIAGGFGYLRADNGYPDESRPPVSREIIIELEIAQEHLSPAIEVLKTSRARKIRQS